LIARLFIAVGIASLLIGLVLKYAPGLLGWFGRLPGDLLIERDGTRVFIPITSMIVLSLVLSLIVNVLFRR
jgi:hypothetical protein